MAKATIAKLTHTTCDGMLFRATSGNYFYVKSFDEKLLILEPFLPMTIYTMAEIIAGCFETRSTFYHVKEVRFTFKDVTLSVTKDNAEPKSIVKKYFEGLENL